MSNKKPPIDKKFIKMDYPSNKHNKKEPQKSKEVVKVTSGKVVKKKKSLGKKFSETFFGDDIESVSTYILHDVILPAAKNMISDTVSNGVEMLLFGQVKGSRTRRDRGKSHVSYSSYYDRGSRTREPSVRNRSRHNFDDIVLETRGEAEEVLSHLVDLTEDYGLATVADLYDLVGVSKSFTDDNYGWDNLSSATIHRVRDGYLISLPRTILLD